MTPEDHCWSTSLEGPGSWCCRRPPLSNRHPNGMSSVPLNGACWRYRPSTTPATRLADVSCRTHVAPWHPRAWRACQDPLPPHSHQRTRLPGPKTPSTNKSRRQTKLSPGHDRTGRHWCLGITPQPSSRHAFTPHPGALDPSADRLFAGA